MVKNADYFKDGYKGDPNDLQDQVPHHQGRQHPHRRADDRRHRLDLGRAEGPGRAHQGQPGPRRRERQDAARLLSRSSTSGRVGAEVLHRQARAPGRGACDQPRVDHQEPGRPGLGRGVHAPCHPDQFACSRRRHEVRLRSRQGQGAAEGGGLSRRLRVRPLCLSRPRVHRGGDRRSRRRSGSSRSSTTCSTPPSSRPCARAGRRSRTARGVPTRSPTCRP